MKQKIVKCTAMILSLFLLLSAFSFAGGTPSYRLGDVDDDGKVSAADARLALRASVGLEKYEGKSQPFLSADVDHDGKLSSADARIILRVSVGLEDLIKAENVAGYPKKDGDKTLRAFFVNGKRTDFDVYTYAKAPESVYAPPCPICWECLGIDAYSTSRSVEDVNVEGAFAARINGYVVTNHTGVGSTKVGNSSYTDLVPEYYHNDYHCSLLLFIKTVDAKVTFSPDGSAVYMSTGGVNKNASTCDDFDLDYNGALKYTGEAEGSTGGSEEPTTKPSEEPTTKPNNPSTTIPCPSCTGTGRRNCYACGGSGRTWGTRTEMRYIPGPNGTSIMIPQQVTCQVTCTACGGVGGTICSSCGGRGRLTIN